MLQYLGPSLGPNGPPEMDGEQQGARPMTTKKLFANGNFVCEYESTGDDHQDIVICRQLLREHGIDAKTTKEQAIFRQAVSFATTASYLYDRDLTSVPANGMTAVPFTVNAVFALELYIKTLGKLHSQSLHGHDLVALFDRLPEAALDDLRDEVASAAVMSQRKCGISNLGELRAALVGMRNAFKEWRYMHEKDPSGSIQFRALIFSMEAFHTTCQKHEAITPRK
jgi:hypothetical protein